LGRQLLNFIQARRIFTIWSWAQARLQAIIVGFKSNQFTGNGMVNVKAAVLFVIQNIQDPLTASDT
jgi:hypothetical protein